jgi:hypothetical protein
MSNLAFLNPKFIEKEINGSTLRFYAIPLAILFRLTDGAAPILSNLMPLFQDTSKDAGRTHKTFNTEEGEGGGASEYLPISVDLARYRDNRLQSTIEAALKALSAEPTRALLGEVIMSSLRDVFPRTKGALTPESVKEFINNPDLDVTTTVALFTGTMEASKGMLGPLGETAASFLRVAKVGVEKALAAGIKKVEEKIPGGNSSNE